MSAWTGRVALGLLLLLCASFCLTRLSETDLHWHLLAGERILQEGRAPRVDTFTYTSAGRPWIDPQWLFQLLVAAVERAAGWTGLDLLKIGLIVCAFSLAALAALRRGIPRGVVALLLLASLVASQERFTLRPEALSFLFLAVLLLLLGERSRHPRLLFLLPPLLALWANCHALFVVGIAVLFLVTAGDILEARRAHQGEGTPAAPIPRLPAWAPFAALVATALNPYGPAVWVLPYRLLVERIAADNLYGRSIAEFQAPFGGSGVTASIVAFAVLSGAVVLSSIAGWRKTRVPDALVLLTLLAVALLARRNIPLFALAAVPCAAPAFVAAWTRGNPGGIGVPAGGARRTLSLALGLVVPAMTVGLLADVWSNSFFERDGTQRYFGRGWAPGFYPQGAADFILNANPAGEVLHGMTMGGYLAWRFQPARRTFIDGRLEVHDETLFATSLRMQSDPALFETTAKRYGAATILWSHRDSTVSAPLLRYLGEGHGWRPIFVDLSASVFTRAVPGSSPASIDLRAPDLAGRILEQVRRAETDSERRDPLPAFLRRLLPRIEVPVAEVNAALFFADVGSHAVAEALFREGIRKAPANAAIHYDLGLVLERSGRPEEARSEFERALARDASFSPAREALALGRLRDGDSEGALSEWAAAERDAPLAPASLVARGALLAAHGRIDEAIGDYRKAVSMSPRDPGLRTELALLCHRRGLGAEAEREIERALALSARGCGPLTALARMSAADGRLAEAGRALREALAAGPDTCPEATRALGELRLDGGGPAR